MGPMSTKRSTVIWWLVAALGFIARLSFAWYAEHRVDQALLDAQTYSRIARNMLDGYGFSLVAPHPTVFVAPLYPALLAAVHLLTGHFWPILVLQAGIWIVIALVIRTLGERWFNPASGYIASLFVLLHPELIAISAFKYSETLFVLLVYVAILFLARAWLNGRCGDGIGSWILAGVALGLATLTRPVTLYFIVLVAALPLFLAGPMRRRVLTAIGCFSAFVVIILPWTVRNYLAMGDFVPVATGGGTALWIGNYRPFDGEYRYEKTRSLMASLTKGMNEVEADRHLTKLALEHISSSPMAAAELFGKKLFRYWFRTYEKVPDGRPRRPTLLGYGLLVVHLVVLATAIFGAVAFRRRWKAWVPYLLLCFYMTAIHVASLPVPRYRLPLLPGILLFAGAGAFAIVSRIPYAWARNLTMTNDGGATR